AAYTAAGAIDDYDILPDERALIANAVRKRQREFSTGRWLSRRGLRQFGLPDRPILMGRLRNPLFPDGTLGTISHDGAICAVAVMQNSAWTGVGFGIDLIYLPERAGRMGDLAAMYIADAAELDAMSRFDVV